MKAEKKWASGLFSHKIPDSGTELAKWYSSATNVMFGHDDLKLFLEQLTEVVNSMKSTDKARISVLASKPKISQFGREFVTATLRASLLDGPTTGKQTTTFKERGAVKNSGAEAVSKKQISVDLE